MGRFLIVAKTDKLQEYKALAQTYNLGFEYNDFYMPDVMDDEELRKKIINRYLKEGVPEYCTMHGAFMDVLVFSYDGAVRRISEERMEMSMNIAGQIGAKGVVFHTNANPFLSSKEYVKRTVDMTADFMAKLLEKYPDINIYLENMFDATPDILQKISEKLNRYVNYGICFDYAHASISDTPIEDWICAIERYIKHVHINDNDLKNDLHLPVGSGNIDWAEFKEYHDTYFSNCTILIETTKPENQKKSIEYLIELGIMKDERRGLHGEK